MRVLCVVPQNIKHETVMFLGLQARGINMHVITTRKVEPDYTQLVEAGIAVDVIPIRKRIDNKAIQAIREIMHAGKFDIVHAFNNKTVSNALRACKNTRCKFIAYRGIVGNVSFLNPASWQTYLNPRVDRIICVAEAIRQHLLRLRCLWLKIPAEKLVTIYKGHDLNWYSEPPADLSQFDIPSNAFVVACAANYRPRKGIEKLIEAWQLLPADQPIHLLLIGQMENKNIQKLLAQHPCRERIHCIGYQENAAQIQAAADICVLPSLKREGLPKSVIEGMAYGVPPIVTDSGGSPELVEHGSSGLVVPPNSAQALALAIASLYQNDSQRRDMGVTARQRIADKFTTEKTISDTFALYQSLA